MRNRRLVLLFTVVVFSAFLMTFQSTRGPFKPLIALSTPLYRLEKVLNGLWDSVRAPLLYYSGLEDENRRLREEVGRYRMQLQEYERIELENRRLARLLRIKRTAPEFVTAARVISSGIRQWPEMIVIDKGSSDGVGKDMAVRTPEGLVGKVAEVTSGFSRVLLVTDVNFSVSVRLQGARTEGILSGRGDGMCILKYISRDEQVEPGEILVTSGLDGLFPEGIPAGRVVRVDRGDELFLRIEVQPFIKATKIEEVMVFSNGTKTYDRSR